MSLALLRARTRTTLRPLAARALTKDAAQPPSTSEPQSASSEIAPLPQRQVVTADAISGAPAELKNRVVRIYQPARNTMQSGSAKTNQWRVDWDILPGSGRWEHPLMGWAASADYMQGTRMNFRSKEDAVLFAEKQGWDYYVQQPEVKRIPPKNYAENYLYRPGPLRLAQTK